MKILVDIKSLENLNKYKADGFIVSSEDYSCYNDRCFDILEIKIINEYCKKNNKLLVVNIDRIIEEEELPLIKEYLDSLLDLNIDYFIYGDYAILSYFLKLKLPHKLIYEPKTMITNFYDADFHNRFNSLVTISNELTLEEIKDIVKSNNTIMEVYGFHQMFYSRRQLLSNYNKFKGENKDLVDTKLIIIEEKRTDEYPVFESKNGTFIYNSNIYCLFKELKDLNLLQYIRINSSFIEEELIHKILNIYNTLINDFSKSENLFQELQSINPQVDSSFLYKKSILLKEED